MSRPHQFEDHRAQLTGELGPWLDWQAAQARSPITVKDYRFALGRFAHYLAGNRRLRTLRDVQRPDLEAWMGWLIEEKYSPVTISCYMTPVFGLFKWLAERGVVFLDPSRGIEIPPVPRRLLSVPSEVQMLRLMKGVTGSTPIERRDRAILEVAYATGFRCAELVALDVGMIDLSQGVIRVVGKGNTERTGILTKAASAAIELYLSQSRSTLTTETPAETALWLDPHGRRLRANALRNAVKSRAAAVRLDITPHAIRRAFATHLLRNGAPLIEIRRLLGHISWRALKHYLRYAPQELIAAHQRSVLGQ